MTKAFNITKQKTVRRDLRKSMPTPEIIMWSILRNRGFFGYKFRRQYSVGRYIIDFYCPELKLAIEIDGESHYVNEESKAYDNFREEFIKTMGIRFIRFTNQEVCRNIDGVMEKLSEITSPHPSPW